MIKMMITSLLFLVLVGCQNTAPVKSKCFSSGRVTCSFTPLDQMWGETHATVQP